MKAFRFKLEGVLEQRRREERDELVALAALERERAVLEARLRVGQSGIERSRELRGQTLAGAVDLKRAASHARHEAGVDVAARRVALQLAALLQRIEQQKQRVSSAAQRRRAMERLRDQRRSEWTSEMDRRERLMLDDLSTARFGRGEGRV